MAYLAKIFVYPIKALDGVEVQQATMIPAGGLQHDREFAICDFEGHFVNGKRHPEVHQLRATYDPSFTSVTLRQNRDRASHTFSLRGDRQPLEAWLSEYFGFPVKLQQNSIQGFPDDPEASGPTVISTATLEAVASWFPHLDPAAIAPRFRSNLEIAGVPAFWEDQLFADPDAVVRFQIGSVEFVGTNPCQRCIVPTRDPVSGETALRFTQTFTQQRRATLPMWAPESRFNHFYKLGVNTRVLASPGQILQVGDEVKILGVDLF